MFLRQNSLDATQGSLNQRIDANQLDEIQTAVTQVHASDNILDYLQRLVAYTRQAPEFAAGRTGSARLCKNLGGYEQPWPPCA